MHPIYWLNAAFYFEIQPEMWWNVNIIVKLLKMHRNSWCHFTSRPCKWNPPPHGTVHLSKDSDFHLYVIISVHASVMPSPQSAVRARPPPRVLIGRRLWFSCPAEVRWPHHDAVIARKRRTDEKAAAPDGVSMHSFKYMQRWELQAAARWY